MEFREFRGMSNTSELFRDRSLEKREARRTSSVEQRKDPLQNQLIKSPEHLFKGRASLLVILRYYEIKLHRS